MACVRSRSIFTGTLSKSVLQACLCPPRWNQRNSNILCTPYAMGYPPEIPGFPGQARPTRPKGPEWQGKSNIARAHICIFVCMRPCQSREGRNPGDPSDPSQYPNPLPDSL